MNNSLAKEALSNLIYGAMCFMPVGTEIYVPYFEINKVRNYMDQFERRDHKIFKADLLNTDYYSIVRIT